MELQGTQAGAPVGSSPTGGSGQAQQVAEQAREVGREALDQAKSVGGQAKQEVSAAASSIKDDVRQQVSSGQHRLAVALRDFSQELDEVPQRSDGQLAKVAGQAAQATRSLSNWLDEREPRDIVRSIEDFARRRPMMFIAISATAGVLVGRLTRGMVDGARQEAQAAPTYPGTTDEPLDLREPVVAVPADPFGTGPVGAAPVAADPLAGSGPLTGDPLGTPMTSTAGLRAQGSTATPGIPDSEGLR
jgi:ElaB/YqjD/DUF883 family membrane-anchored ribosome-binding protein